MSKLNCKAILAVLLLNPVTAWAQNMPIEMVASNQATAPAMGGNYDVIGYWDVDDWVGNNGSGLETIYSGVGTHQLKPRAVGGTYMAALGINMSDLSRITDLRTTASNDSVEGLRYNILQNNPGADVVFTNAAKTEYVVGIWDVDDGGGFGNDGSRGIYAMTLTARLGTRSSDRKLVDLFLIASNKRHPALKEGYEVVGYWDVDNGGARGTSRSSGAYMMTLLAKWH